MTRPAFPTLSPTGGTPRQVAERVNGALAGKLNCTGEMVILSGETTALVPDSRVSPYSVVVAVPANLAARALRIMVNPADRQFLVEADAAPSGNALFYYAVLG